VVKACEACQFHKYDCSQRVKSYANIRPDYVFDNLYMDILFLDRKDNNDVFYVLNIVDAFSGYLLAISIKMITGNVITAAIDALFKGLDMLPKRITIDNGSAFISQPFIQYCKDMKIDLVYSSAYNYRSHGLVERANQTITRLIATNSHGKDMDIGKLLHLEDR
jgi:transposase InsO family protein